MEFDTTISRLCREQKIFLWLVSRPAAHLYELEQAATRTGKTVSVLNY